MSTPEFEVHRAIVHSSNVTTGAAEVRIPSLLGAGQTVNIPTTGLTLTAGEWNVPSAGSSAFVAVSADRTQFLWLTGVTVPTDSDIDFNDNVTIGGDLDVNGDLTVDTDTLHVDSTNNRVGIGTTSPAKYVSVENSYGTNLLHIDSQQGFDPILGTVVDYPRVGIGAPNPAYELEVNGDIRSKSLRVDFDGLVSNGLSEAVFLNGTNSSIRFRTSTTDKVTIDSSGNVGIGTTSPTAKLEVNGDANVSGRFTHTGQWAACGGPTSHISGQTYWNRWGQYVSDSDFISAGSTGIYISRTGRYYVTAGQRANSTTSVFIGIASSGSRSALDSRSTGIWSHDHASQANQWTLSTYIGVLNNTELVTMGHSGTGGNSSGLVYGTSGYAGFLMVQYIGD